MLHAYIGIEDIFAAPRVAAIEKIVERVQDIEDPVWEQYLRKDFKNDRDFLNAVTEAWLNIVLVRLHRLKYKTSINFTLHLVGHDILDVIDHITSQIATPIETSALEMKTYIILKTKLLSATKEILDEDASFCSNPNNATLISDRRKMAKKFIISIIDNLPPAYPELSFQHRGYAISDDDYTNYPTR